MCDNYEEIYKSICRVCLSQSENTVSLIDNLSENGLSCFGTSVMAFANVLIEKTDKLPSKMCQKCVFLLKQAISFKLKCESSDRKLKLLIEENISKNPSDKSIKELLCQYILFNSYFSPECDEEYPKGSEDRNPKELMCIDTKNSEEIEQDTKNFSLEFNQFSDDENITTDKGIVTNLTKYPIEVDENMDAILDTIHNMLNSNTVTIRKKKKRKNIRNFKINDSESEDNNGNNELKIRKKICMKYSKDIKKSKQKTKKVEKPICNICNKLFLHHSSHRIHMKRHENGENLEGRPRKRKFKTNPEQTTLKNKKQYICKICDKILANHNSYKIHMTRHNQNNLPFICDQCGKRFAVPSCLQMHLVTKHGIGPCLQCDYCSFKTTRKLYLIEHLRLHTGERPFSCEHCGLTFRRRAIWRKHLLRYTEKKFQCTYCPLKFHLNSQLTEHCNNVHERKYLYICKICSVTYNQSRTVRRHMISEHGVARENQGKIMRVTIESLGAPK